MEAPDQKILCFPALPIPDFSRWREESSRNPSPHWAKVTTDTGDARSITLWLRACPPYRPTREGVALSSFYIASNALHAQTRERALNLPLKPLLAGYGIGAYGRNGLIAVPIAPHSLRARAMLTSENDVVEMDLSQNAAGREATLFIDGDMAKLPSPIKHMYVRRGAEPTTLLRYKGENFYEYASSAFF